MDCKYTVIVHRTSCEVLSASAEAYSFIGGRFYHPFDHLVFQEDLEIFRSQLNACSGAYFAIHLIDEQGHAVLCMANAVPSANAQAVRFTFYVADRLIPAVEEQAHVLEMKNHVLSIYGDEYFEYSAATDRIRIYRMDKYEQTVADVPLQDFFNHMRSYATDENSAALERFCTEFRSRMTTIHMQAPGNLLDQREAARTLIKGRSLFELGEYVGAAGVIHFGTRRSTAAMAERDSLTGLLSKAEITSAAISLIDERHTPDTNLLVVDVDHFKHVNDTCGHMEGDAVLKRIASILVDEVGSNGLVGRIGGDEFLVVYFRVEDMENHRELLRSIKSRVAAVYPGDDSTPGVSLSIGCAAYPKDADSFEDVFRLADFAMYRAKHNGRNRYVIFDEAKHGTLAEVLKSSMSVRRMNDRGDMTPGDILCTIMARVFRGEGAPIEALLEEAAVDLSIQRIMLYAGTPWRVVGMAGEQRPDECTIRETIAYLDAPGLLSMVDANGMMVLDDVERISAQNLDFYSQMKRQGILSCVQIRGVDADDQPFLLSLESVSSRVTWNPELVTYYSLFRQILRAYHLT